MLKILLENGADLYAINNVSFLNSIAVNIYAEEHVIRTLFVCLLCCCCFCLSYYYGIIYPVVRAIIQLIYYYFQSKICCICLNVFIINFIQDGNTPYSIALSGGNMDIANFVMTYASKSPQRDSGSPLRIYNMKVLFLPILHTLG